MPSVGILTWKGRTKSPACELFIQRFREVAAPLIQKTGQAPGLSISSSSAGTVSSTGRYLFKLAVLREVRMPNIVKGCLTALAISLLGTSLTLAQAPDPKGCTPQGTSG